MTKTILALSLIAAMSAAQAQEKTGAYVGIGSTGTVMVLDVNGVDDPAVQSFSLKAGYAFNENVAIEGRVMGESGWDSIGYDLDARLDGGSAVYARLSWGNPTFDPYILLGYASLEATLTHPYYGSESETESGGAYGIGANWNINESFSITGDWTVPVEDVVQFNVSLDYKF